MWNLLKVHLLRSQKYSVSCIHLHFMGNSTTTIVRFIIKEMQDMKTSLSIDFFISSLISGPSSVKTSRLLSEEGILAKEVSLQSFNHTLPQYRCCSNHPLNVIVSGDTHAKNWVRQVRRTRLRSCLWHSLVQRSPIPLFSATKKDRY